jgi:DNA invertase Pin-like site-specific DNA recombinase
MKTMKYGYIRVSTLSQDFYRQQMELLNSGVEQNNIFEEKVSGTKKATTRPVFEQLVEKLNAGDEIYFESMSRMARSMQDLIDTTNMLVKKKHVKVVFLKENLTIGGLNGNDAMATLIFNIMGSFAQFERDLIADRTKQGIKARRELLGDSFKIGREKKNVDRTQIATIKELYGTCSILEIQKMTGLGRRVVERIINEECK